MLGRKSSLKTLLALLHSRPIGAAVVQQCEFLQGSQARWGLAWSFDPAERQRRELALQQEQQQARAQAAAAASTLPASAPLAASAAAASSSSFSSSAAPVVVTPRARARIDFRRSTLSGAQVRTKLLELTNTYAQEHGLACQLTPPSPQGFEWSISMQAATAAAPLTTPVAAASPTSVSFQCALRLLHAPPSDWMVELEWKKPAAASDRSRAQLAFTLFANQLTRMCAASQ